jgi:hypothetical protein
MRAAGARADLTPENRRAWEFFRRCRATGRFPDDPVVAWYAEVLRGVYDTADRAGRDRLTGAVLELTREIRLLRRY